MKVNVGRNVYLLNTSIGMYFLGAFVKHGALQSSSACFSWGTSTGKRHVGELIRHRSFMKLRTEDVH